jgi:serine/threonine protein phosphatase 1
VTFALPPGHRVYAVGDVHGCLGLLSRLMARIDADVAQRPAARITEVFIGDYVDRGPDSRGVVARLAGPAPAGRRRVCLTGNHEDAMLGALADPALVPRWLDFGGDATVRSYGIDPSAHAHDPEKLQRLLLSALPACHRRFLEDLPACHRIGDTLFVHAGIRPGVALEAQERHDLIWIREPFLDHRGPLGVHVVHGHTPADLPETLPWRTNVDTGAVYGGALTAAVMEGEDLRFLSVHPH